MTRPSGTLIWPVASALAGGAWTVATFLPWRTHGVLSSSTLIEAARFARRGTLDVVPAELAAVLLAPALVGIVLIGLVGLRGRFARIGRSIAGWSGSAVVVLLLVRMAGTDPTRWGTGAVVAAIGVVMLLVGAVREIFAKVATDDR